MNRGSLHTFIVIFISMGALIGLSCLPWSRWTGNRIKDFDLFGDLFPKVEEFVEAETMIDPELEALMVTGLEPDTVSIPEELLFVGPDTLPAEGFAQVRLNTNIADSTALGEAAPELIIEPLSAAPVLADGSIGIENYSAAKPLANFARALEHVNERPVRIAVIGDSFIEGDILTQNLRDGLQEAYGGRGVGYVNMRTEMAGFRQSVNQSGGKGWKMTSIKEMKSSDTLLTLAGEYGRAEHKATSVYKGAKFSPRTKSWGRTSVLFIAPNHGNITISVDDDELYSVNVSPSPMPQMITLDAETTIAEVTADLPGIIGLGTYLSDSTGIQLDCMSVRGYSGISHRRMNVPLAHGMAAHMPYDLIILEYGMNALSASQTNYVTYEKAMIATIERIREAYPLADILVLGISDRGHKKGGEVHSMATSAAMTQAQRKAASATGAHFWDMRAAMGGSDAVVQWRKDKLVNADYIHLNHKGGAAMAKLLQHAIQSSLNE
ncbi:MAG: hypothetical protein HDT09_04420 [Bacteroidales bacterium]|nr:hypothetical protein [Bacteroidales bacterium]